MKTKEEIEWDRIVEDDLRRKKELWSLPGAEDDDHEVALLTYLRFHFTRRPNSYGPLANPS